MLKNVDGTIALIGLVLFAVWLFVLLPLIYIPGGLHVPAEILGVKPGEWLLFLATMGLWFATWRLVSGADKNAAKQLRPYVFLSAAEIRDPLGTPRIKIKIKNFGQTPAYGIVFWNTGILREYPLTSPLIRTNGGSFVPKMDLGPTGMIETEVPWNGAISQENRQALVDGRIALYFFGQIDYNDAFGKSWYTKFRFVNGGEFTALTADGSLGHSIEGNEAT